jgi:hypothetical protein
MKIASSRSIVAVAVVMLWGVVAAHAQDTSGCDQFAWPVSNAREQFASTGKQAVALGGSLDALPGRALALALAPRETVQFPVAPGKSPKDPGSFGGFVTIKQIAAAGLYQFSLSDEGWIDVVQGGAALQPTAHSGRKDCAGLRKTLRYELAAGPVIIELSAVASDKIQIAVELVP